MINSLAANEALAELQTIRDMLRWSVTQFYQANLFYGHGTDNAWDEAVTIVLSALHLPHDINPQVLDAKLSRREREEITQFITRRINEKIPAAYLTQRAYFAGLPFYVDERVIIPRSAIAELIEQQFTPWIDNVSHILDLCTGSGCIAIACAHAFPNAAIDAVDISSDALAVAKINVDRHHVNKQVNLIQSDLFQNVPIKKYDIIVSNPPYVNAEEMESLPDEYRHEPSQALAAGADGLEIVVRILKEAKKYLSEKGILIIEVGNSEKALSEKYPTVPFTWLEFERGDGGVFLLTRETLEIIHS
jgi:ribosomal protein L3 glutamine methyltransferase